MTLRFRAVDEERPGPRWLHAFHSSWPAYRRWFLSEGDRERPGFVTCRDKLRQFMPELVATWERLVDLAGGGDQVARMLSLYRPPPYFAGCSQAVSVSGEPLLLRNYDYHPRLCEGVVARTAWSGARVLAMVDCLWGVLDGVNERGLSVSLSFGGSKAVGDGFGIPLILRYVLETCGDVAEACAALQRIPSHMAYNIALLDRAGRHATVFVSPDRPARVTEERVSTNHQEEVDWREHARFVRTELRKDALAEALEESGGEESRMIERLLAPPLFQSEYRRGAGTLYTAVYRPRLGTATYHWPNIAWDLSLDRACDGEIVVHYGASSPPSP